MPTPSELRAEIESGPLAGELAPLWSAGADADVAAVLTRRDLPGYIPPVPLSKYLDTSGLTAALTLIRDHRLMPCAVDAVPSVAAPFGLYALASRVLSSIAQGFRPAKADVSAGCDALIGAGVMTSQQKSAILALEVKIGRVQQWLGDYDATVTAANVEEARKL